MIVIDTEPSSDLGDAAPCPFCGSAHLVFLAYDLAACEVAVACAECRAYGPQAGNEDLAVTKWNARA